MRVRSLRRRRPGAVIIESAIVYPIFFLLTLGMVVMSMGVFRYQEVSLVAHEAARYASVRGGSRQDETSQAPPTEAQIRTYITNFNIQATADAGNLTTTVMFNKANGTSVAWDSSNKSVYGYTTTTSTVLKQNTVSVTVSYAWTPEFWPFPGSAPAIPLSSTSTVAMQY